MCCVLLGAFVINYDSLGVLLWGSVIYSCGENKSVSSINVLMYCYNPCYIVYSNNPQHFLGKIKQAKSKFVKIGGKNKIARDIKVKISS